LRTAAKLGNERARARRCADRRIVPFDTPGTLVPRPVQHEDRRGIGRMPIVDASSDPRLND